MTSNTDIAIAYLDRVQAIDTDGMRAMYHPDASIWIPGRGTMNRDELCALLGSVKALFVDGSMKFERVGTIAEGEMVAVQVKGGGDLAKGGRYENDYCFVFRMKDGLIADLKEYTDSGPAIAAFHS
jgi:uncharacterized protein